MDFIISFIVIFLLVYSLYYFFSVRKARKNKNHLPAEVQYLIFKYQLDLSKVKYKKLMNSIALVGSLDVALVSNIIFYFDSVLLQILVGIVLIIPVILISFSILGKYYQKKMKGAPVIDEEVEEPKKKKVLKEKMKKEKGERKK